MSSPMQRTPRFIYKIHSARLRRVNFDLQLNIEQARITKELVSLNESQVIRWFDELKGIPSNERYISDLRREIKTLRYNANRDNNASKIQSLVSELDSILFKPDYVTIIIDRKSDYDRIFKKGFTLNGIHFVSLFGTTGGIKKSTVIFINEKYAPEIKKRIDNGRQKDKEFTPAKLEAYESLACSASIPVSFPHGICVVHDCVTHFLADVISLDDTNTKEPLMEFKKDEPVELIDSDGYGLGMPSLMKRWGNDLGEDYILSGCVIRNSFCKGTVFCVDFQQFAKENNVTEITDVWGDKHKVSDLELILTESMLKLWDSYPSLDNYLQNCSANHYTFAVTKYAERELENQRTMNYQFLQSYDFSDADINELLAPTINSIEDILDRDYRKMILYMKGTELDDVSVQHLDNSIATALMIEPRLKDDPFIRKTIKRMIAKRIDEAKIGVIDIDGNYSLVSGDPYSLCQSMCGLEVTGLLKAGEVYSKYWIDHKVDTIVSFRAPMTCHNNIRKLKVVHTPQMDEFYKYMTTPTIFNSWDTCDKAMNGFDKDGDCVINTSTPVIVRNTKELPAIMCIQRKAPKVIPTERDFFEANVNSFGNDVGSITNKITSMFEVLSKYDKGTKEYETLEYRIKCGQLYQQNSIDRAKGIDAKPMPSEWYDWNKTRLEERTVEGNYIKLDLSEEEMKQRIFNRSILAEKKPYFMRYIYPACNKEYKDYVKMYEGNVNLAFKKSISDIERSTDRTEEEQKILNEFYNNSPLGIHPCVINRICWKVESVFDSQKPLRKQEPVFDYSILKSNDISSVPSPYRKKKIAQLFNEYNFMMQKIRLEMNTSYGLKKDDFIQIRQDYISSFYIACEKACPDERELANILIDLCYKKDGSKQFVWDLCADTILDNLLKKNNYKITYPRKDKNGDIDFNGEKFKMVTCDLATKSNADMFNIGRVE